MRNPVLTRAVSPLHSLPAEEIKRHAIHREKLRIRWGRAQCPPDHLVYGSGWFDDRGSVWLLVEEKPVLFMSEWGNISPHRIRTCGERPNVTLLPVTLWRADTVGCG